MKRKQSLKRIAQDQKHMVKIQEVKKHHLLRGCRLTWKYLNNRKRYKIGKNCVQRLMQENNQRVNPTIASKLNTAISAGNPVPRVLINSGALT
ncbi:MAG: hypothetical protein ACLFPX_01355 [Candidatus Omnitrophota bacterium]